MKVRYLPILLLLLFSTFLSCSYDENNDNERETTVQPRFPEKNIKWGNLFAKTITNATKRLESNKENDPAIVFNLIEKNINNFYNIQKDPKSILANKQSTKEYNKRITDILVKNARSLTLLQNEVLNQIDDAKSKSQSFTEFTKRLVKINDKIYSDVPKKEQEKLFFVTSTLYFGFKAIDDFHKNKAALTMQNKNTWQSSILSLIGVNTAYAQHGNGDGNW